MRDKNTPKDEMAIPSAGYAPKRGTRDHISVVYIIGASDDGPVKIGITGDICSRLDALQVGSWQTLQIFDVRLSLPIAMPGYRFSIRDQADKGALALERACHAALKDIGLHIRGEWFDLSAADALAVLRKCAAMANVRCVSVEDLASVMPDSGLDPEVAKSHKKLLSEMLHIKAMACAKSGVPIDELIR